jgi:hypothetical protein
MWLRPSVGVEPRLVVLIGSPIDETGMMAIDKNRPLSHGEMARPFLDSTVFIDIAFMLGFAVDVSASIHRIREDVMDRGISRSDPADRTWSAREILLQGRDNFSDRNHSQTRRAEPNSVKRSKTVRIAPVTASLDETGLHHPVPPKQSQLANCGAVRLAQLCCECRHPVAHE